MNKHILTVLSLFIFYSNVSLAEELITCNYNECKVDTGGRLDKDIYKQTNTSSSSNFIGKSFIFINRDDINKIISDVRISGLGYSAFDVNKIYSQKKPFELSLNSPTFEIDGIMKDSWLENGIFMPYSSLQLEKTTIKNAIFFAGGEQNNNNTVTDGQIIISDELFKADGYFNDNFPVNGNTSVNKTTYMGESSEIIKSDSKSDNNLSSSDSIFNDSSNQYLSGIVSTEKPTFNNESTQILKNNSSASDVTLNDNSESTVYNSAKQTGTTTVNDSAQLTLITGSEDKDSFDTGAYAENINLNSEKSQLNIVVSDSDSSGNKVFVGTVDGKGNVSLKTDGKGNYSNLIADNISGDNSYTFDVDIKGGNSSLLTINNSSNGEHIVNANNNGAADTNGTEKITIIEDNSGENAKATFASNKNTELGGYTYTVQRDSENTNNWVIVGKKTENGNSTINDTAKSITGLASSSYLLNQAELSTLRQRMGDLITDKTNSSEDISGVWGRVYGGRYKTRDNANFAKVNMNYYGFQLGGDINTVKEGDDNNYVGLFVGHTTGKPDYARGDSTVESWYGGFYDTFITENNFYIDSVFKFGQYRNKYNLSDSQDNALNGKVKSNVLTLSSEIGKRFILTTNDAYNLYLEPQAQLTWSRIGLFNTSASNGLNVKQDAYNSVISRLGVLLGSQINKQSDVYLKVSYLHEFKNDVKYKLNNSEESYNVQGNGVEIGIGGNIKLNENGYLYLEANYINSHAHYTGSKFNVGYRYNF